MPNHKQPPWPGPAQKWADQSLQLTEQLTAHLPKHCDVSYGGEEGQQLDIYLPKNNTRAALPVIAFVHGGYFTNGDKRLCGHMAAGITQLPAIFVSIGYHLTPQVRVLQQIEDVTLAVSWLYHHIAEYGGNPDKIVLGGHSSGGTLASWVALNHDDLEANGCPANTIKLCMPVSGVYDFENSIPRVTKYALESMADAHYFSPVNQTNGNYTPFVVAVGEHEFPQMRQGHDLFYQRLQQAPGTVKQLILPGLDHFSETFDITSESSPWMQQLSAFYCFH
ncbi:MAG: alpha/beta hydrolase [Coxiellaceae bacterium]|nr:alpha/beta hydrolase [Coxiellaceae bacterium]